MRKKIDLKNIFSWVAPRKKKNSFFLFIFLFYFGCLYILLSVLFTITNERSKEKKIRDY